MKLGLAAALIFAALQLFRPSIPAPQAGVEIQVTPPIHQILEKDCYSCHSNQRRLAWFDEVVPGYWLVRRDILTAREHLNFSTLGSKPAPQQKAALFEAVNMIRLGAMPLGDFTALHPDAKVAPQELATLQNYLTPWSALSPAAAGSNDDAREPAVNLGQVAAELNGLAFEPGFEKWKPLSFTDRGDNSTFRFILGNDIATKAAQSGHIAPWPDGTRFAKIAWQQELGSDGLVHPGAFVQVEFMIKDARLYKKTAGWGWGRWRGLDLKPYGSDREFTLECVGCHQPLRGADYVYTPPLTKADVSGKEVVNRAAADLRQSLPWQPLAWNAITMYVNPTSHTMAVLFGDDRAMQSIGTRETHDAKPPAYAPGAVLALLTWAQRDDPHWFGARIPDSPQSVEFVSIPTSGVESQYRCFQGVGLPEQNLPPALAQQRANSMLNLAPASLP
ncbi:MAG: cytochrome P460 family protein [Terracidiphilus sp.]